MTEKRFTLKSDMDWWFVCDGNKQIHSDDVVELLNMLHEENIELKEAMKRMMIEFMGGGR